MNQANVSIPMLAEPVGISQFAYGKIIQGGLDVSGYAQVAQSTQLPDETIIQQIRDLASVGQVYDLTHYTGSVVAFIAGEYAVAARFQRSPKQDSRGYFLQEHYILLPYAQFNALGANFSYLINLLPVEIPWRKQVEALPLLPLPQRNRLEEQQRVRRIGEQYSTQVLYVLQLTLDGQRFAITATQQDQLFIWHFLETVSSLLPVSCRGLLSWGYHILNLTRNRSRLKVVIGNPAGSDGYLFVRLAATSESRLLTTDNDNTRSYLTNLQEYLQRFGWQPTLECIENMPYPIPENWADLPYNLAVSLWQAGGASIMAHQLLEEQRPYSSNLLTNVIAILRQDRARITASQHVQFLTAVLAGCLDGVLPIAESMLLPLDIPKVTQLQELWSQLSGLFNSAISTEKRAKTQIVFKIWKENQTFWQRQDTQEFVYKWQKGSLMNLDQQAELMLQHIELQGREGLTPLSTQHQVYLLSQAVSGGQTYWPHSLLSAWLAMATTPQQAQEVAHQVEPLQKMLWQDPNYGYIVYMLQGYPADSVDHLLKKIQKQELNRSAKFLLLLAWKGLHWQLPGFAASELILTLDRQAEGLPGDELEKLVAQVASQLTILPYDTRNAFAFLLLSLGRSEQFARLVQGNKDWITLVIQWQERHPVLNSTYHQVMSEAVKWFEQPPVGISYQVWLTRLKQVFERRTFLTCNTPQAINILAKLLLEDAFAGYTEEGKLSRLLNNENKRRVEATAAKIQYVRETLFPANAAPAPEVFNLYLGKLREAFETWSAPRRAKDLVKALHKNGLEKEASYLNTLYFQKRGTEVLQELGQAVEYLQQETKLDELVDILQEVEGLSAQEVQNYLIDPRQKTALRGQVRALERKMAQLSQELSQFQNKL